MERNAINPPQLFTGKAFSQTFSISGHQRLIFVSGQVDCGVDGKVRHPDDLDAQLVGTLDNLKIALGKVGLPLFKALTEEMKDWNKWLDANQDKVAEFGKTLSDGLVTGFRAVKSAVQFLVEHSDTIIAIGKVWAVTDRKSVV